MASKAAVLPAREVTVRTIDTVGFGIYRDDEIRALSVKRLTNPVTLDLFGNPLPDGLYDAALGPINNAENCKTCGLPGLDCPGHFGHVELPVPVYNPLLLKELQQLLRSLCFNCHRLRIPAALKATYCKKLRFLLAGDLLAASRCVVPSGAAAADDADEDPSSAESDEELNAFEVSDDVLKVGMVDSNVLSEIQTAMGDAFAEVAKSACPYCGCQQPKVKKVGKFKFMVEPLSARQLAKNASKGIRLRSVLVPDDASDDASAEPARGGKKSAAVKDGGGSDDDSERGDDDDGDDLPESDTEDGAAAGTKRKRTAAPEAAQTGPRFAVSKIQYLDPREVYVLIQHLWQADSDFLNLLFQCMGGRDASKGGSIFSNGELFFVHSVLVPPNKFRPVSVMGDQKYEHAHNVILSKVMQSVLDINDLHSKHQARMADPAAQGLDMVQLYLRHCQALQNHVNQLIDSSVTENADGLKGIRQLLEKKEGLFRMNMMGKRVNFAARSVISPDPNIGTGEIGVPPFFASRLSFPEPVTHYNVTRMRELVINGEDDYPGAVAVEDTETGVVIKLGTRTREQREAIAKQLLQASSGKAATKISGKSSRLLTPSHSGKVVYRHLQDGDIMLTNRQPTLHKPGLMAHRARVLHGERTIRFHYANCSTFNADFDGDEINLHLPQEQQGRAEGYFIVHADHQFKVPTDGKPVRGLIQDHVIAAVMMTKRDTFIERDMFMQLCHVACSGTLQAPHRGVAAVRVLDERPIPLPEPAILKPRPMWTGKQVLNTLIAYHTAGMAPLSFACKCKVSSAFWGADTIGGEYEFRVRTGYIVHGTLDKAQYGGGGLLHACQELYGGPVSGAITSSLSRLFTFYCQRIGFTCGMGDLLLTQEHEDDRQRRLRDAESIAVRATADLLEVKLPAAAAGAAPGSALLRACEKRVRAELRPRYRQNAAMGVVHDQRCSGALNPCASSVTNSCFPGGLVRPFLRNCMSLMTTTGAKGGLVNFSQISAMLGQQDLEGRRVPRMSSGKTLPCFAAFDTGARSSGFIADRFLTGLRPQEYYFHCMAGRDGLVDTAVKTARSGYLQRCMIKNLEALKVAYDNTVRDDAGGSIVQFMYGEDGLDVLNTSYMTSFDFLEDNIACVVQDLDMEHSLRMIADSPQQQAVNKALRRREKLLSKPKKAPLAAADLPLLGTFNPSVVGVMSEKYTDALSQYLVQSKLPAGADLLGPKSSRALPTMFDKATFDAAMKLRYMRNLVAPGESVGIIAGQSIGEPSTQMTLNTFHMAGRGEANVTLGIPRLRELLMTAAKKVKTPVMKLPLRAGKTMEDARVLASKMRKLRLAECLKGLSVEEVPFARDPSAAGGRSKQVTVQLQFHAAKAYPKEAGIKWEELAGAVEGQFAARLIQLIALEFRRAAYVPTIESGDAEMPKEREPADEDTGGARQAADLNDDDAGEADEDENREDNEDFREAKDAGRGQEAATYDTDGEEDDDAAEPITRQPSAEEGALADAEGEAGAEEAVPKGPVVKRARRTGSSAIDQVSRCDESKATCEVVVKLPLDAPKVLMLELAEAAAAETFVRATEGIDKVFVVEGERGGPPVLQVDGINFAAACESDDVVDVNGITCNDVAAMLRIYGVEAARNTLVSEVRGVFGAYGIGVDFRHLSLIGDHMTHGGGYRACNRIGIGSCVSPFLKMSFETSATFLKDAAMRGALDTMESAAARIVLGQPVGLGTGHVSLHMDLSAGAVTAAAAR